MNGSRTSRLATPTAFQIERAMSVAAELRQRLVEELGDDDQALLTDVLDGQTEALDIARALIRASLDAEAYADATEQRIKALRERKARFERRHEATRQTAFSMLEELGLPGITDPEFSVSRRPGKPPLIITEPEQLPDRLCRIKREPDRTAIRAELESGATLDAATLGNAGMVWSVRTK